jgi:hypothetical protein
LTVRFFEATGEPAVGALLDEPLIDPPWNSAQNDGVVRAIAAVLVVLFVSTIAAPLTCAGWEGSARARRECCKRADHTNCPDQRAADNCCAAHEQSRPLTAGLASLVQAPRPTVLAVPAPAYDRAALDQRTSILLEAVLASRFHGPPPPLISPLRI